MVDGTAQAAGMANKRKSFYKEFFLGGNWKW
jgi:hypothetical protein